MNDIKLTSDKIGKKEVKKLRQKLLKDFLHTFPLDSLQGMTLEQYTNLNKDDSFCYWLESRTYELGSIWGGSSYKFGIYEYRIKTNIHNTKFISDEKYAWYARYNNYPTYKYRYHMWQYTETGRVDGIQGNVDLNVGMVNFRRLVNNN